jgi:hypothetical protein
VYEVLQFVVGPSMKIAICGRQRPSPEAALFDTPGCDLDISKTAVKVTRRRILALTREL